MMWSRRVRNAVAVVAVCALGMAACGNGSASTATRPTGSERGGDSGSSRSHPFVVGWLPDGYELVVAGTGAAEPEWSDESVGATPNLTVLRPRGGSAVDDVLVSADGGDEGFPSNAFLPAGEVRRPADGAVPLPAPIPGDRPRPVNVLLQARGDVQFDVRGRSKESVLRAVADAATMPDRHGAPVVADPPDELTLVGSVSSDAALALAPYVARGFGAAPGPRSAHAAAWQGAEADLVVLTVPGRSLDLDVVADHADSVTYGVVAERRSSAVVLRPEPPSVPGGGFTPTVVLTATAGGDVAVVAAVPHRRQPVEGTTASQLSIPQLRDVPSEKELLKTAASIGSLDEAAWSSFVERANGGPGFHADPGAVALASGERSDVGWLLQDPPGAGGGPIGATGGSDGTFATSAVPSCLKLADGSRPCANTTQGGGSVPGAFLSISTGTSSIGSFVIVERSQPGGQLHLTTSTGADQRPMVAVPGERRSATVVFSDQSVGILRCPAAPDQIRLEIVEDDGSVSCLGSTS